MTPVDTPTSNLERLEDWAEHLGLAGLTEPLEPLHQRLGLMAYRMLADGRPVSPARLAAALRCSEADVVAAMSSQPGVVLDERGHLTAYLGLTLKESPHVLEVDGRRLFTWCAWDTMLVVPVLGRPARVSSACVVTGVPVDVALTPAGATDLACTRVHLTMVTPDADTLGRDFHAAFCARIHFVASEAAGDIWLADNPDGLVLSLDEAFVFALARNARVYGDALEEEAGSRRPQAS